jgi:hypothetical protein
MPTSARAGTFGRAVARWAEVTPRGISRPDWMKGSDDGIGPVNTWRSPATTALTTPELL